MPQEKGKATIYDVADKAGVAISTVSRVLNDSSDVSDQTRARVLKAIEELQFRPDRTAKSLAQKQTRSLAIATPTFTTPFHNELLKGVRLCLRNYDVDLLLCDLGWTNVHRTLLNFLKRGAVDGLLLAGLPEEEGIAQELKALHAPVVIIGYHWKEFDSFYWDNMAGSYEAVRHLIDMGHRKIAMIATHSQSMLQEQRVQGYMNALQAAGIPFQAEYLQTGQTPKHAGFSEEAGYEAMQSIMQVEPSVTAVFASSDVQAIGAWKAIRDAGKRIPEDIALVGYDDIKISEFIGLSSVDQSMHDVGLQATELLLERVLKSKADEKVSRLVTPKLIVRESSRFRRDDA